jgi:hypothetical protein
LLDKINRLRMMHNATGVKRIRIVSVGEATKYLHRQGESLTVVVGCQSMLIIIWENVLASTLAFAVGRNHPANLVAIIFGDILTLWLIAG